MCGEGASDIGQADSREAPCPSRAQRAAAVIKVVAISLVARTDPQPYGSSSWWQVPARRFKPPGVGTFASRQIDPFTVMAEARPAPAGRLIPVGPPMTCTALTVAT